VRDEVLGAAIVLKAPGGADDAALLAHCRARLAAYKLPRLFRFVAESDLPLTVTGKIQKNRIVELFQPPRV
jgi:fatty-acyl-CoA synthase